jgi:hypothetical protein
MDYGRRMRCTSDRRAVQQEAPAGITAGEELSNRQVGAVRELWLMPSKMAHAQPPSGRAQYVQTLAGQSRDTAFADCEYNGDFATV